MGASERGKPPNALRAKGGRERRRRRSVDVEDRRYLKLK
jgi:hypothetical protein